MKRSIEEVRLLSFFKLMKREVVIMSLALSGSVSQLQADEAPPSKEVVLSYSFEEKSGKSVADKSGYGNNGIIYGEVSREQGKKGGTVGFNGKDTYVLVSDSESLDSPSVTGQLTIEGWLYREDTDKGALLVKKGGCYQLGVIGWDPTRVFFAVWDKKLGYTSVETETGVLKPGIWQHVAGVCDGKRLKVYVNGKLVMSKDTPAVPREYKLSDLTIGVGLDEDIKPTQGPLEGKFDEVSISNQARGEEYFKSIKAATTENFETTVTEIVRPPKTAKSLAIQAESPASISKPSEQLVILENGHVRCEISLENGARIDKLINKHIGMSCLNESGGSPLFYLMAGDERFDSRDFKVDSSDISEDGKNKRLKLLLSGEKVAVDAELTALMNDGPEITWSLKLTNRSDGKIKTRVAFPFLENIKIGENLKDNYYFWPMLTGIVSNKSYSLGMDYGQRCLMPVMDVFNPSVGGGVGVWAKDPTGSYKGILLQKTDEAGKVRVDYNNMRPRDNKPKQPFTYNVGLAMAIFYLEKELPPSGTFELPDGVIGVHPGICTEPLKRYSDWAHKTWYKHPPVPKWFQNNFNIMGVNYKVGNAGFTKGFHPGDHFIASENIHPDGRDQHLQWAGWWKNPDMSDHNINGEGDYEYNPEWGGLEALKEEIQKCQAKGSRITFYACSRVSGKNTRIAKEKGEEWGFMDKPGHMDEDWDAFNMCTHAHGWQDYLAEVYGRIMKDTGIDGMYLDTSCEALFCFNPRHPHAKNLIDDQVRLLEKIRNAIKSAKPDGSFMMEFCGSDYFSQFVDGAWAQTFAHPYAKDFNNYDLCFFRFCFPEVKLFEWGQTAGTFPVDSRRCFFNGIGNARGDLKGNQTSYLSKTGQVMEENGDAFASLNPTPFVETRFDYVYANEFPVEGKHLYTIYNKNDTEVKGEIMEVKTSAGTHYVEAMYDEEVPVKGTGGKSMATLSIPPKDVVCLVRLPQVMELEESGDSLKIKMKKELAQPSLKYYLDTDGNDLASNIALTKNSGMIKDIGQLKGHKLIVKLFDGKILVDEIIRRY